MCSLISLIAVSGVIYIKAESGNLAESRLPSFVFPDSVLCYLDGFCLAAVLLFNLEPSVLT